MPTTCCVKLCNARHSAGESIKFFRFPADEIHRRLWINKIRRIEKDGKYWEPKQYERVCSKHFITGERSKDPHHPDYIPNQSLGYVTHERVESAERYQRVKKRQLNKSITLMEIET